MSLRWLLGALVLVTLLGLYANEHWMTRRLVLDGRGASQHLFVVDDSGSGGASTAALTQEEGGAATLHCDLRQGYEWPFCDLQIEMLDGDLDLTRFSHIRLWLQAQGPTKDGSPPQVRVFLRTFHPGYSAAGGAVNLKPHEVVFAPGSQPTPVEFRLSQFMVASWWAQAHPLPVPLMGPQLDRMRVFSVTTGGQAAPGRHIIRMDRVELVGNWVPPETFRLGLLGLWMASLLGYLAWEGQAVRRRLRRSVSRTLTLEKQALRDPLTQAANREGLNRALEIIIQAQGELSFPLSIVFLDADNFKRINDDFGHEIGDQVLTHLAQTLRANLPRDDLLARWGGEEFVIAMPRTPVADAVAVVERLRKMLASTSWPAGLAVTASWGVAQAGSEQALDAAMREADQAMYRAKREGRDRVISACA